LDPDSGHQVMTKCRIQIVYHRKFIKKYILKVLILPYTAKAYQLATVLIKHSLNIIIVNMTASQVQRWHCCKKKGLYLVIGTLFLTMGIYF